MKKYVSLAGVIGLALMGTASLTTDRLGITGGCIFGIVFITFINILMSDN